VTGGDSPRPRGQTRQADPPPLPATGDELAPLVDAIESCTPERPIVTIAGLDAMQVAHARTIVTVGLVLGVPKRALVIALVAAVQESSLRNLANPVYPESFSLTTEGVGTDHDSLGIFQQRPSTGWGRVQDLMVPQIAAERFYRALVAVPGWQTMVISAAAQAVQRSAYPDAYAHHETLSLRIAAALSASGTACVAPERRTWVAPVIAPVISGYQSQARPHHEGVDLGASRGTPIRAAGAGVVATVACNASAGNCDRDGSSQIRGCGWYVEIRHAGDVVTRYCHLHSRPEVSVGQHVTAGQRIGRVGSSGQSSGPHLHFEVHLPVGQGRRSTTDPVPWIRRHGAPLG